MISNPTSTSVNVATNETCESVTSSWCKFGRFSNQPRWSRPKTSTDDELMGLANSSGTRVRHLAFSYRSSHFISEHRRKPEMKSWLSVFFLLLLTDLSTCLQSIKTTTTTSASPLSVVVVTGRVGVTYSNISSLGHEMVYVYNVNGKDLGDEQHSALALHVASPNVRHEMPLQIEVTTPEHAVAWRLPYYVQRTKLTSFNRTLCIEPLKASNKHKHPVLMITVRLATTNRNAVSFTLQLSKQNVYKVDFGNVYNVQISLTSSPIAFRIDLNNSQFFNQLKIESDNDVCMTAVLFADRCMLDEANILENPLVQLSPNKRMGAHTQTIDRKGGFSFNKKHFRDWNGLASLMFVVHPNDRQCGPDDCVVCNEDTKTNKERIKHVSFSLEYAGDLSKFDYAFYGMALVTAFVYVATISTCALLKRLSHHDFGQDDEIRALTQDEQFDHEVDRSNDLGEEGAIGRVVDGSMGDTWNRQGPSAPPKNASIEDDFRRVDVPQNVSSPYALARADLPPAVEEEQDTEHEHYHHEETVDPPGHSIETTVTTNGTTINSFMSPLLISLRGSFSHLPNVALVGLVMLVPGYKQVDWDTERQHATGDLSLCYNNYRCSFRRGHVEAANRVLSNVFYLTFGGLIMLLSVFTAFFDNTGKATRSGIVGDSALFKSTRCGDYMALGLALFYQGVFSSFYHMCPNSDTFQLDLLFIYVGLFTLLARTHFHTKDLSQLQKQTLFYVMLLLALSLPHISSAISNKHGLKVALEGLLVLILPVISLKMSVLGPVKDLNMKATVIKVPISIFSPPDFIIQMAMNYAILGLGFYDILGLSELFLILLTANVCLLLPRFYARVMMASREWKFDAHLILAYVNGCIALLMWLVALPSYLMKSYDTNTTEAHSLRLNSDCVLFNFFDMHDIWHMSSAAAILFTFFTVYCIDTALKTVSEKEVKKVFTLVTQEQ